MSSGLVGVSLSDDVQFSVLSGLAGDIGVITLSRSQRLNALTTAMCVAMTQQLLEWRGCDAIQMVLLDSAEPRFFCAGGDIRMLYEHGKGDQGPSRQFFQHEYSLNHLIAIYPKPIVVLADGIVMGGGVGLSVYASHRVAGLGLRWAMPETAIGFFTDVGASYFLPQCSDKLGWFVGLTGQILSVGDAIALGLMDYAVPIEDFSLIRSDLLSCSSLDHQSIDGIIINYQQQVPRGEVSEHAHQVTCWMSEPTWSATLVAMAKDSSDFAQRVFANLRGRSALAMAITYRLYQESGGLTLAECLQREYGLCQAVLGLDEVYEGVRAMLVDKDGAPQWGCRDVDSIAVAQLDSLFAMEGRDRLLLAEG